MRFDTFCLMVSMELDNMMWISISIDSGVSVSTVSASSSIDSGVQSTVEFNRQWSSILISNIVISNIVISNIVISNIVISSSIVLSERLVGMFIEILERIYRHECLTYDVGHIC